MVNPYIGHDSQIEGVEELKLVNGKGKDLTLYRVYNKTGLELTISKDRCLDISRLRCKGVNLSYISSCGYVAPSFYDRREDNFLKSFTAGFLTTCGLENVGSPCIDNNEVLTLHGSIANTPSEYSYFNEDENYFYVHGTMKDEVIFARKLVLNRLIKISKEENVFYIEDEIENRGDKEEPFEILYHMNMGYPLLDEDSIVDIPSSEVIARNEWANKDINNWKKMEKPQNGYIEKCYYHKYNSERGIASIYQPKLNIGLKIEFDSQVLDGFVEWKMMGVRDYVLGLECGNCYPDGRDKMRESKMLKFIKPNEKIKYIVKVSII